MAVKAAAPRSVNPGPSWGYAAIVFFDRWLPRPVFNALVAIGVMVGICLMPPQRRHSRAYLAAINGRKPRWRDLYRHFRAFTESLIVKLTLQNRGLPEFAFSEDAEAAAFRELCAGEQPVLFGTFHVGYSDLIGCLLSQFERKVSLVRLRVGNSLDTDLLGKLFADKVNFIWINEPEELLFGMKSAIERGSSLALQCDRVAAGGRLEAFRFMGARRQFPFTIYHLSAMFRLPVVFAFTVDAAGGSTIPVYTSPVFRPVGSRAQVITEGRAHFQAVLGVLESHLQRQPNLWFNFLPLNPSVDESTDPHFR
jgi:predicted LPLAT superfamily acyltransferase